MMKKLISLAILVVMALSMVACNSTTETNAPAPVAEGNTPAEAK
jgi:hypothetical protein